MARNEVRRSVVPYRPRFVGGLGGRPPTIAAAHVLVPCRQLDLFLARRVTAVLGDRGRAERLWMRRCCHRVGRGQSLTAPGELSRRRLTFIALRLADLERDHLAAMAIIRSIGRS